MGAALPVLDPVALDEREPGEHLPLALEGPQPELVQEVLALIPETEMPIGLSKERVAELFAELDRILAHHQELARAELEDEEEIVLMAGLH